jgi:hypothetical protein
VAGFLLSFSAFSRVCAFPISVRSSVQWRREGGGEEQRGCPSTEYIPSTYHDHHQRLRHSLITYRLSSCPSSLLSNPSTSRNLETRGEFRSTVSIFRLRAPHWAINIPTKITTTNSQATYHTDPWIRTSSFQERCVHGGCEVDLSRSD